MTQLTQEHFDEVVKGLATKEALAATNKALAKVTATVDNTATALAKVTATVDNTAILVAGLVEDFRELKDEMKQVKETLTAHTDILDGITKNTETWKAESTALRSAVSRHERWIQQIARKVGVNLDIQ